LAPLPPEPVSKDSEVSVSPGAGIREVRVIRSAFREPMTRMVGLGIVNIIEIEARKFALEA